MTEEQLDGYHNARARVTLRSGEILEGYFQKTPEPGLYHVHPFSTVPGVVSGGWLADIHPGDIKTIESI